MRVSVKQLEQRLVWANKMLGVSYDHINAFYLAGEFGGYRVSQVTPSNCHKDITPLGTKREVYSWLTMYMEGYRAGVSAMEKSK